LSTKYIKRLHCSFKYVYLNDNYKPPTDPKIHVINRRRGEKKTQNREEENPEQELPERNIKEL